MQTSFAPIDHFRVAWVLEDSLKKLCFLSKVSKEDGTSSELAEYEINKTLAEQARLEANYTDLLRVRSTLKGISDKRKLEEIQAQIQEAARTLKDNTKKLGRLFRENPSFEKETEKVNNQKAELIEKIETIINSTYQSFSLPALQTGLIDELEIQDHLRKQGLKEQGLVQDIKQLHAQCKKEEEDYQNIMTEKQAHIQQQKENLSRHQADAVMESKYRESEMLAKEGTIQRLQNQKITDLQKEIEDVDTKKKVEGLAFNKIKEFLNNKEEETKVKINDWNTKFEENKQILDLKVETLLQQKEKALAKLAKLKEEFEVQDNLRKETEKKRLEKEEALRKREEEENKMEDAIKAIQERYQEWKEKGGTVKKPKKSKSKKAGKK